MFAHVALPIPVRQTFAYRLTDEQFDTCRVGALVRVPFGRKSRHGVVVRIDQQVDLDRSRIKTVQEVLTSTPVVSTHGLSLAGWMADYYLCPIGEALAAQLPGGMGVLAPKRKRSTVVPSPARSTRPKTLPRPFALTAEQARAIEAIVESIREFKFTTFLLHGVTGSGKTRVYLEAAEEARRLGGQALFLVPEVTLAHGLVSEVRRVFGSRVGVLHSYLTAKERRDSWERCRAGDIDVLVGARSAVFAPLADLRLVVVDEEHEPAYKQTEQLRYHGRDVAVMRASMLGVPCVLGSATPSLESFANVARGKSRLLSLPNRVDHRPLPTVEVVEQRQDGSESPKEKRAKRGPALLTPRLGSLMEAALSRGEQVLLFLNRRGHSRIVECEVCGATASCPHCDLTLTFHSSTKRFLCHYCEYSEPARSECPQCASPLFRYRGSGTQRVERELARLFPETQIHRLDSDSARKRGVTQKILEEFGKGEGQILVGTQLVAKGHDFAGVTLVGVLNSDTALHVPDFRASERTFQLLTQVAGRAGRGSLPGHVILQTHFPDHPALLASTRHDFDSFAEAELQTRRDAGYPPWKHLVSFLVSGTNEERVIEAANQVGDRASEISTLPGHPGAGAGAVVEEVPADTVEILGPAPQTLARLRGRHRWHVTLRDHDRSRLHRVAEQLLARLEDEKLPPGVRVIPDVDPVELL